MSHDDAVSPAAADQFGTEVVSRRTALGAGLAGLAALSSPVIAQDAEGKVPPPREMAVLCRDMTNIVCTFYAGTKGKDSTPIILLHDHKGNRRDLEALAISLQTLLGAAVIAPDLRGHGDSPVIKAITKAPSVDAFGKPEFEAMIEQDLEAVKKFLVQENDGGRLNIDKLCLVGIGAGGGVASLWGVKDWSWKVLTSGKQGQDVKALVLISPSPNYRGLNIAQGLSLKVNSSDRFRTAAAVMIIAGENDSKAKSEAASVAALFKQGRTKEETDRANVETCTLFTEYEPTKLQGTKLVGETSLNVDKKIAAFIQLRVADKPTTWQKRSNDN